MEKTLEKEQPRRAAFAPWRRLSILLLMIIAMSVGILVAKKLRRSDVDRGSRALIDAFSKRRLIEPRLSGGFKGAEFRPSREDTSDIETRAFEQARELIIEAAARGDSSADLPYARLLLSKGEKPAEALNYVRRAVASAPDSAEAHNDLGLCLIQEGKLEDAIEEFEIALKLKAEMPEASFNRALCYQRLALRDAASEEFSRLGEIEHDPSWRNEIERRYQEVSGPLDVRLKQAEILEALHSALAREDAEEAKRIADLNFEFALKHSRVEAAIEYLKYAVNGIAIPR